MLLPILEKWVENGSFNAEQMAEGDHSRSMAILLVLNPDAHCKDIESMGIGLIVHGARHRLDRYLPFLMMSSSASSFLATAMAVCE